MSMTTAQKNSKANWNACAESTAAELLRKAREAYDAIVPLPHTNESGERVVHRDNQTMWDISDTYRNAARAIVFALLPIERNRLQEQFNIDEWFLAFRNR